MKNFDCIVDTNRGPVITTPVINQTVTVTRTPSAARGFVAKKDEDWRWDDLRDYVVHQIEKRTGTWPRDHKKECGIFKGFLSRWGSQAPAIARYAFEVLDGRWNGEPVTITRFCKGSDPFFATVIEERLTTEPVAGW